MAGRFINPLPQFSDSTPTMYAGAKLYLLRHRDQHQAQYLYHKSAFASPIPTRLS
jgi:hypothetical protein